MKVNETPAPAAACGLRGVLILLLVSLLCQSTVPAQAESNITRTVLPNGLVLIVKPSQASNLTAVVVMLKVTAFDEPEQAVGMRSFLQEALLRGAKEQSEAIENWGGQMAADVGLDYVEFSALVISDGLEAAVQALAGVLRQAPLFDDAMITKLKQERLDYLTAAGDEPFHQAYQQFREELYGSYPYGRPTLGERRTIKSFTPELLSAFYSQWYVPNNTVVAICGNVSPERARRAVERAFAGWPSRQLPERSSPEYRPLDRSLIAAGEGNQRGAHVIIGFPAPAAGRDRQFAGFQVLNSLLGRGMSGRLVERLRRESGLAYEVYCFYPTLAEPSHLAVYVVCETRKLDAVKAIVVEQINQLLQQPPGDDELAMAKRYLLGDYLVSQQRTKQQAYCLAWYETIGLGAEFQQELPGLIGQVTPDSVSLAANIYLHKMVIAAYLPR